MQTVVIENDGVGRYDHRWCLARDEQLDGAVDSGAERPVRIGHVDLRQQRAAAGLQRGCDPNDLHEREARIRRLVDLNIIGIMIWDIEGRITEANQAFLDMLGYSRENLISGRLRWTELTPPEWRGADELAAANWNTPPPTPREGIPSQGRQPRAGSARCHDVQRQARRGCCLRARRDRAQTR